MMVRIGVIKTRNEWKTILYSLNRPYFDTIIGVLSRFPADQEESVGKANVFDPYSSSAGKTYSGGGSI